MRRKKLDRIVLDTNIWISYTLYNKLYRIAELIAEFDIEVFTCPEILSEFTDVLKRPAYKKYLTLPVAEHAKFIEEITTQIKIDKRFDRAADPDDNFLFDLAYTAKCYYVVTDEPLLLNMKHVHPIQIISFKELLQILRA